MITTAANNRIGQLLQYGNIYAEINYEETFIEWNVSVQIR